MFSYQQTSRWLSFSSDPLTVEDWLANREVFGPVEKPTDNDSEMEKAYVLEKERLDDLGARGIYEKDDLLLICATGKGAGETFVIDKKIPANLSKDMEVKLKVRCKNNYKVAGKNEFVWQGKGKTKIIIDSLTI